MAYLEEKILDNFTFYNDILDEFKKFIFKYNFTSDNNNDIIQNIVHNRKQYLYLCSYSFNNFGCALEIPLNIIINNVPHYNTLSITNMLYDIFQILKENGFKKICNDTIYNNQTSFYMRNVIYNEENDRYYAKINNKIYEDLDKLNKSMVEDLFTLPAVIPITAGNGLSLRIIIPYNNEKSEIVTTELISNENHGLIMNNNRIIEYYNLKFNEEDT